MKENKTYRFTIIGLKNNYRLLFILPCVVYHVKKMPLKTYNRDEDQKKGT
jgi:hypothetical protein